MLTSVDAEAVDTWWNDTHLWGDYGLNIDDLTEEIELGERVSSELLAEALASGYSSERDRQNSMHLLLHFRLRTICDPGGSVRS